MRVARRPQPGRASVSRGRRGATDPMPPPRTLSPDSLVVALGRPAGAGSPVNTPVTLTSTYHAGGELVYGRDGSAASAALESALGTLEGGDAVVFSSGMAAVGAVLDTLGAGALVVAS